MKVLKYLFFGVLFWLVGSLFAGGATGFVKRSEPAQLIVLELQPRVSDYGVTSYRPVFGLDTAKRPRPEYTGNTWVWPKPHTLGSTVDGRYDKESGQMRSDVLIRRSLWAGRIAQIIGFLSFLQGILMMFGIPERALPLRLRFGS